MAHDIDLVMDFQYGSTGKGLIVGYLAKRGNYDTAVCSFATNAGHTYIDGPMVVMTQQLPVAGVVSPTVKNILLGPGSAIHEQTLIDEIMRYHRYLDGKRILIHPHAAVVEDYHTQSEVQTGMTKIGSTAKGVGAAYVERIRRNPSNPNVVGVRWKTHPILAGYITTPEEYLRVAEAAENVMVEGAQGYSLSMYHGQYPFTTSRDVTPWQIMADCGLPFKWAPYVKVIGTLRTYPIRVSNRDGTSGPCYPDQQEIEWKDIGLEPELTTVTKLPRRVFTFSRIQLTEALWHCQGYWETCLFLNFANYMKRNEVIDLITSMSTAGVMALNPPRVAWVGTGPSDTEVFTTVEYLARSE